MSRWRDANEAPPAGREMFPLRPGEVHLWRIPLEQSAGCLAARRALLSAEERTRLDRYRFPELKERFVARRGALRTILSRYVGVEPVELRFQRDAEGKPRLDVQAGAPRVRFNLSDSEELALLAVTLDHEIGVDLEALRPLPELESLARDHLAPREREELLALPESERLAAFFRVWMRKEAWLKALGSGLAHDLDTFAVTLAPRDRTGLVEVKDAPTECARWSLRAFVPAPGFIGALAIEHPRPRVRRFEFP